jgi:hypothetical protein
VSVSDRDLARAEALGRLAARGGKSVRTCPYEANGDPDQRILAARFVRAYIGAGGQVAVDYDDQADAPDGAQQPRRQEGRPSGAGPEGEPGSQHPYGHLFPYL